MFNRATWSTLLGSLLCFPLTVFSAIPVLAAERITFFYPPFGEFQLGIEDLEIFAKDGTITKNFAFYAERVSPKELEDFRKLLNQNSDLSQFSSAQWQNAAVEFNFSQRSFKSNIPEPNDPSISQLASDLQFQAQVESEETQPIVEKPLASEMNNQPTESASSGKLAEQSQNPIANLISVPFQNNTNFGVGDFDRTQNILNIQPVIPIDLNDDWLLVTRTILPVTYQPVLTQTEYNHHFTSSDSQSSHFGLGDLNPQFFFVPKNDSKITWGVGPTFLLPTATDDSLGTKKWGIGPTAVVVFTDSPWVVGALINNIWSVAGNSDRSDISQFLIQPFINYNLSDGWYLVSGPIITANWNASSGNKWTIPIGGGVGKIFKIGNQSVNASLQGYWNAETPEGGADWTLRTQIQLLFPE